MIIGLAGRKRAGKDSFADAFLKRRPMLRDSFAYPIKQAIAAMFEITIEELESRKHEFIPGIGKAYRDLMQTLGTEWGRDKVHADIWVELLAERYAKSATRNLMITDVRFDNEAKWINNQGGKVFLISRPVGTNLDKHRSEKGVDDKYISGVIFNDHSLEVFQNVAKHFAEVSL